MKTWYNCNPKDICIRYGTIVKEHHEKNLPNYHHCDSGSDGHFGSVALVEACSGQYCLTGTGRDKGPRINACPYAYSYAASH